MSQDAAPPRIRLHLTVTDVGPVGPLRRGAEIMILTEDEDKIPKLIGADSVEAAVDLLAIALKPMIRRLLWGADQPRATVPDPVAPLVAAVDALL